MSYTPFIAVLCTISTPFEVVDEEVEEKLANPDDTHLKLFLSKGVIIQILTFRPGQALHLALATSPSVLIQLSNRYWFLHKLSEKKTPLLGYALT